MSRWCMCEGFGLSSERWGLGGSCIPAPSCPALLWTPAQMLPSEWGGWEPLPMSPWRAVSFSPEPTLT